MKLENLKNKIVSKIEQIDAISKKLTTRFQKNGDKSHFAFNIKVYDFLTVEDIEAHIEALPNLTDKEKEALNDEFAKEERANSIFWHTCEQELESLFEYVNVGYCGDDQELKAIDKNDLEQGGRNGGWLFYTALFLCGREITNCLDDNITYADLSTLKDVCEKTGLKFWREYKKHISSNWRDAESALNALLDNVNDTLEKLVGLEILDIRIDQIKNCFGDSLVSNLDWEIESFIEHDLADIVEESPAITNLNHIEKIENGKVITNAQASCTLDQAREALKKFKNGLLKAGDKIGNYTLTRIFTIEEKTYFKIGCHKLALEEIQEKLARI